MRKKRSKAERWSTGCYSCSLALIAALVLIVPITVCVKRGGRPILRPFNNRRAVSEAGPEQHVCVGEETLLQGYNDELRALEPRPEELPDMLCMR